MADGEGKKIRKEAANKIAVVVFVVVVVVVLVVVEEEEYNKNIYRDGRVFIAHRDLYDGVCGFRFGIYTVYIFVPG